MKIEKRFWTLMGLGVLLLGLLTSCGQSHGLAVDSPLATLADAADEKAVLAIDLGWGNPRATRFDVVPGHDGEQYSKRRAPGYHHRGRPGFTGAENGQPTHGQRP